jgi:heavy metal sensor kinase
MPIRFRIALATAFLMVASLLILGGGVYITMSRHLHNSLNTRLASVYQSYRDQTATFIRIDEQGRPELLIQNPNPFASSGVYLQILDPTGEPKAQSQNLGNSLIPVTEDAFSRNTQSSQAVFYTASTLKGKVRVVSGPIYIDPSGPAWYLQVAEPLAPLQRTLDALARTLIFGSVLATIVLAAGAWIIADTTLNPLVRMSHTAQSIGTTRDLSQRIEPPRTHDEVRALADTFNDMLARLEEVFNAQRRFVADASHELRTPLTALRANSDIMLRQIETGIFDLGDLREGLTDVRDEVERMTRLVQNLLTLARADVGWRPEMETVDLAEVVRDTARIAAPLSLGQTFAVNVLPQPERLDAYIPVHGNPDQLRQLILILLDNAFNYSPPGTDVTLEVSTDGADAIIAVEDNGPGIPPNQLQRIFERFYRSDESRSRTSGGSGLGLSIARWIVAIHDGTIEVDSDQDRGTTFTIHLPMVEPDDSTSERPASATRAPAPMG